MEEQKQNKKTLTDQAQEQLISLKESEYLKLKEEAIAAKEYSDRTLRLQADFENMRKRLEKEKQDFVRFANEEIILELLNILDDLERVVDLAQAQHQDLNAFLKGVEMILAHLYEMLKKNGIKPIEAEGKPFNPHYHEALMQVENKDLAEHTIVEELQKGYLLNEKVIRTTKAKVSKKS
ncbi:MAG: nucleotide exchange factor GrpE [Candidatus Omnitrophota bacterium]|nr:nucleotide exchange factor GrpE [Candidatus Omnitrophota bacterium]